MTDGTGHGTITDFFAVLAAELANPPGECIRTMAQVLSATGGGDHLGLMRDNQPAPETLRLLDTSIHARARPQASVLLEWVFPGQPTPRHYSGWALTRDDHHWTWRRLSPTELRDHPGLHPEKRLGDDPLASFA
jgi:hypothetical protein